MVANIITLEVFNSIPKYWKGTYGYNLLKSEKHYEDGFRDLEQPNLNDNEGVNGWYYDDEEDKCFYNIVELSKEEIEQRLIIKSNVEKENLIISIIEQSVINEAHSHDDDQALENASLYPFWSAGMEIEETYKYQRIVSNELRLYKVIQSHTSQADWTPENTPNLFVRVGFEDEILVWVQPTGAHDAYNTGDKVKYPDENGSVYESNIDANIWKPEGATLQYWNLLK